MPMSESAAAAAPNKRLGIIVVDTLPRLVRGQPYAGAVGPDGPRDGLRHLPQQPDAISDRAAIGVGPEIGIAAQELVDQIAIGRVDLDTIEAGRHRVARSFRIIAEQPRDFIKSERPRFLVVLLAIVGVSLTWCGGG